MMERYSQALSLSLSLSLSLAFENTFVASLLASLGRKYTGHSVFSLSSYRPVIYTCRLRLDFHSFVLFALVLRALHCRTAISSRCLPPISLHHPQKTGRRFSIKCPAIKTAGRRGRDEDNNDDESKLYSNDGVRTLFLPPCPLLVDEASNGIYERRCSHEMSPVFKALLKEYSHEPGRALFMSRTRVRNVHGRTRKADRGEAHVSSLERTGWNQVSYP